MSDEYAVGACLGEKHDVHAYFEGSVHHQTDCCVVDDDDLLLHCLLFQILAVVGIEESTLNVLFLSPSLCHSLQVVEMENDAPFACREMKTPSFASFDLFSLHSWIVCAKMDNVLPYNFLCDVH